MSPSPSRLALLALIALVGVGLAAPASPLAAQDSGYDFNMPEELQSFWDKWYPARDAGDQERMDELAKDNRERAEQCLDLLLDDLCQREITELHHEVRSLAWALDAATRSERYITRVRLVLELEMRDRVRRFRAKDLWFKAIEQEEIAQKERVFDAWETALQTYLSAYEEFLDIGDNELALYCLSRAEQIERQRERPWERARFLQQVVALGAKLPFREPVAAEAQQALDALLAEGIDPNADKPADLAEAEDAAPTSGGRDLEAYAEGSKDETFSLTHKAPKKGLPPLKMPTVNPAEQFQLWPKTWIAGMGPAPFDTQRSTYLAPWGKRWQLSRSGISQFEIDSDGDGEPDVSFSASNTPSRIEVPGPDGEIYPLMVCVLGDRELMFGIEVNYAPNQEGSRLRFWLAGWMEGQVLDQPMKIYDLNMDGKYGPAVENWDDLITYYQQDDSVNFWEPDGVLVGRSKKAIPMSTILPIGDDFYRCKPSPGGKEITLRKMDMATGEVKINAKLGTWPEFLVAREVGKLEGAFFDILPARKGGKVTLPAGTYQICLGQMRKGKKMSMDAVRIYTGKSEPFMVHAGATTELDIGAPFDMTFTTRSDDRNRVLETSNIRVFGKAGLEYAMWFDEPLQPDVSVRDENGRSVVKGDTLQMAGIEHWQTDTTERQVALWFPVEYEIEEPKNRKYEFKLTQKKHAIIGGPLESDWIR